jgi:hypothetical protein
VAPTLKKVYEALQRHTVDAI